MKRLKVNNQHGNSSDILIKDLRFVYPPPKVVEAIRRIDLEVKSGEYVAIIGHNGSGKTTLSKLISGFLEPTEGSLTIGGESVHKIPPRVRPSVVGYVFQNPDHQVFKDTVWEDVAFGLENLGYPEDDIQQIVHDTLQQLDLWELREVHPFRLGKGDRQRVAVAGLIVMNPKILLVDEPTTGQDPERARDIMRLMTNLNKERGVTVIAITHAMDLVAEFVERVVVMGAGEILLDGDVREVFSQPEVLAKTYVQPPQIARLGLELNLNPLPLSIDEIVNQIVAKSARKNEQSKKLVEA
jgi:energy-coupling factor transport system ATP-binding protein